MVKVDFFCYAPARGWPPAAADDDGDDLMVMLMLCLAPREDDVMRNHITESALGYFLNFSPSVTRKVK